MTTAGPDANLTVFDGHELHIVSAAETLTFEHSYTWWGELHSCCQTLVPPFLTFIGYLFFVNLYSVLRTHDAHLTELTHPTQLRSAYAQTAPTLHFALRHSANLLQSENIAGSLCH